MSVWLSGLTMAMVVGGFGLRLWFRTRRRRRIASRRRVEAPNSYYSAPGVRNQEDRERWGSIDLRRLHPLNQEEVDRLLRRIDDDGIHAISPKDRLFLDNMTLPRMG
jgi:hypothetical protein